MAPFLAIPALAGAQDSMQLDLFDSTLPRNECPADWTSRKIAPYFGSGDKYYFRFIYEGNGKRYIHLKSGNNNSFSVGSAKTFDVAKYQVLEWEWKITKLPEGGDVRHSNKDDQAGALCLVVNPGLIGFKSLCYLWENDGPIDVPITSTKRDDSRYLILHTGTSGKFGTWVKERRNIFIDYMRVFGGVPEDDAIIGMQIDSDDTESSAEAFYRKIVLNRE